MKNLLLEFKSTEDNTLQSLKYILIGYKKEWFLKRFFI